MAGKLLRKIKYSQAYDLLSPLEFDFINEYISRSEDGTYKITKKYLDRLIRRFYNDKGLQRLLGNLYKNVTLGKEYVYFKIE